jgi:hypothetical protein
MALGAGIVISLAAVPLIDRLVSGGAGL